MSFSATMGQSCYIIQHKVQHNSLAEKTLAEKTLSWMSERQNADVTATNFFLSEITGMSLFMCFILIACLRN